MRVGLKRFEESAFSSGRAVGQCLCSFFARVFPPIEDIGAERLMRCIDHGDEIRSSDIGPIREEIFRGLPADEEPSIRKEAIASLLPISFILCGGRAIRPKGFGIFLLEPLGPPAEARREITGSSKESGDTSAVMPKAKGLPLGQHGLDSNIDSR